MSWKVLWAIPRNLELTDTTVSPFYVLRSSVHLYNIYDPQYSTEVSVAKAISYLLHDQSNDILLASSSPFYSTGKWRLQTPSSAFVKIRSPDFFLGLLVALSHLSVDSVFHSLFRVDIPQILSSTMSRSYFASLSYLTHFTHCLNYHRIARGLKTWISNLDI